MRAVIQKVKEARVEVEGEVAGRIGEGILLFLGIRKDDTQDDIKYLVEKVLGLRMFDDDAGKMNPSITDVGGEVLVVSQFTLYGDCRKGRRPSFDEAASPDMAEGLYDIFVGEVKKRGINVQTGRFPFSLL